MDVQLIMEFPAFYGTYRFITMFRGGLSTDLYPESNESSPLPCHSISVMLIYRYNSHLLEYRIVGVFRYSSPLLV
jgi:hypothetical protein